ncbi:MAG: hypothetical protein GDA38_17355 [Hormoscilla sp. SP12CHS1]|nr:hypothetical protein [Hormoscilla sp. SP12CHS1]
MNCSYKSIVPFPDRPPLRPRIFPVYCLFDIFILPETSSDAVYLQPVFYFTLFFDAIAPDRPDDRSYNRCM